MASNFGLITRLMSTASTAEVPSPAPKAGRTEVWLAGGADFDRGPGAVEDGVVANALRKVRLLLPQSSGVCPTTQDMGKIRGTHTKAEGCEQ